MKIIIFVTALLISTNSFAQYSSYYKVSVDQNINLNQNVNLSGSVNVNKNIKTIDYGQLALANAQREKKRLDNLRYADEQERRIYLEIVKANLTEANRYSIFLWD